MLTKHECPAAFSYKPPFYLLVADGFHIFVDKYIILCSNVTSIVPVS